MEPHPLYAVLLPGGKAPPPIRVVFFTFDHRTQIKTPNIFMMKLTVIPPKCKKR